MSEKHYKVLRDGDSWCAVRDGFINLQESDAGFGETPQEAITQLTKVETTKEAQRCKGIRHWECTNCGRKFDRGRVLPQNKPDCPSCKCGPAYVYEAESEVEGT